MCDLGKSVNIISFSIFKNLGLGELKPTSYFLKFANGAIEYSKGIMEDVIIKVDIDDDELGRAFVLTSGALIDVLEGTFTLIVSS